MINFIDKADLKRAKTPNPFNDEKEWSFRPEINRISAAIAKKTNTKEEKEAKPIWESLYKLNNEKKLWLEQKRQEAEEQERIQQESYLTFKPKINSDYEFHDPRTTLYERSQNYMKNEKLNEEMEKKRNEGIKIIII